MAGCGCGGSGGFETQFVAQDEVDPNYFWNGSNPAPTTIQSADDVPAPETPAGAKVWNPATGTTEP